jgi:hypothetical protein
VEDMNEKMYDFEERKRNNLIFYGIPETTGDEETDDILVKKINQVWPWGEDALAWKRSRLRVT